MTCLLSASWFIEIATLLLFSDTSGGRRKTGYDPNYSGGTMQIQQAFG